MAIFGYARVSTKDQKTENQRLEIERAGYSVDYWFADTVSGAAHAAQREWFGRLLDKIRKGDTLVVSKLDRLGRDAPNVLATIETLASLGVKTNVLRLGQFDLTSPPGKLMLSMLAAVAQLDATCWWNVLRPGWSASEREDGRSEGRVERIRSSAGQWSKRTNAAAASAPLMGPWVAALHFDRARTVSQQRLCAQGLLT